MQLQRFLSAYIVEGFYSRNCYYDLGIPACEYLCIRRFSIVGITVLIWEVSPITVPRTFGSTSGQVLTGKWLLFVPEWRVDDLPLDLLHTGF